MTRIKELLGKLSVSSYRSDYHDAKARRICIVYKEPAEKFRDKGQSLSIQSPQSARNTKTDILKEGNK